MPDFRPSPRTTLKPQVVALPYFSFRYNLPLTLSSEPCLATEAE
ncbi:hypothetical protein [Burkholderia cenocepacia]|nr:hypothetical protein [Burkholderia cenocepacia]